MEQNKNNTKIILLVALLSLILAGGLILYQNLTGGNEIDGTTSSTPENNSEAKDTDTSDGYFVDFTVIDMQGQEVSLSDFIGTPMVVNFWASWCPPCKAELPDFDNLASKYQGEINFLMVNITDGYRETLESASEFISENGYAFPVYFDTEGSAANAYYTYSLPTTIFFDAQGNLVARYTGMMSEELIESYIEEIH